MTIILDIVFPLIVPSSYFVKGTWELPHHSLPNPSFILTWVTFNSAGTMNYLTQNQYQELDNNHKGWQQKSFENLRLSIAENEFFFSQYKMAADGQRLLWICFMNSDGIGSSRILLSPELSKAFPGGYYLAFPDRSCALVIPKDTSEKELKEIKDMVKSIFKDAATPMSAQLHTSSDFTLPEHWTQPINTVFSNILADEVLKLRPIKS